jgi:hypothetical protein
MLGHINDIREVVSNQIEATLGDTDEGHMLLATPRVYFNIPNYSLPDEGEVPLELTGTCYENPGQADEIIMKFVAPALQVAPELLDEPNTEENTLENETGD